MTPILRWTLYVAAAISLFAASGARAQIDVPPATPFEAIDARGVNLATGAFTVDLGSVSVGDGPGRMTDSVSRTGPWAYRHSVAGGITKISMGASLPQTFTVTVPGAVNTFTKSIGGNFFLRDGPGGVLVKSGSTYTFTYWDGTVALFSTTIRGGGGIGGEALLTSVAYPDGEVWTYHYTGSPYRLQSVTNNYGYQIHFRYETASTTVEAINNAVDRCSPTANICPAFTRTWPSLTFTAGGGFSSITDALGRTTRTTSSLGQITGVARPTKTTGQNLTITYDTLGIVKTVNDGQGTWTYAIGQPPLTFLPYNTTTTITDPLGHTSSLVINWSLAESDFDGNGILITRVVSTTDQLGNTTTFNYDEYGRTNRVINPEGDEIRVVYGPNGLPASRTHTPKAGSGLSPTNVHLSFDDCSTPILCLRPTSYTDARGAVTDYTYDAAGNLLTETGPAPTAGAARPQTRYVWEQRYAWYKQNGSSSITRAATPVWVQVEQSQCMTGATC